MFTGDNLWVVTDRIQLERRHAIVDTNVIKITKNIIFFTVHLHLRFGPKLATIKTFETYR